VRKAYRKAAQKAHPDREGGSLEAFQDVKLAYDTIIAHLDAEDNRDIFTDIFRDIARRAR
jgi:DnaJ-class molecular chaperone